MSEWLSLPQSKWYWIPEANGSEIIILWGEFSALLTALACMLLATQGEFQQSGHDKSLRNAERGCWGTQEPGDQESIEFN